MQQGREIRLNSKYKDKWRLIAKEQDGVSKWKITKRKKSGIGGFLLKPCQGGKILRIGDEEFDQIRRVIRY